MKKIFVVGPSKHYSSWIDDHELVDNLQDADIVIFTGGEDVDPSLYNCEKHRSTYSNLHRDLEEKAIFEQVQPHQLCIGICRGSQLMAVLNGGLLIQNVDNHATLGTHPIISAANEYDEYEITSTHHQMQYPFNLPTKEYKILYYSYRRSNYYEGDKIDFPEVEPEIVLYTKENKPKCLAIQGHPEIMRANAPVIKMLNDLIDTYVK
jgi:gamma-glutamyl-gamma-aminobutyrate hydrolase PuuD